MKSVKDDNDLYSFYINDLRLGICSKTYHIYFGFFLVPVMMVTVFDYVNVNSCCDQETDWYQTNNDDAVRGEVKGTNFT